MTDKPLWGPWGPAGLDPNERKAQFRSVATLVHMLRIAEVDADELIRALRLGEHSSVDAERARLLFDKLPTLMQRRIIATWNTVNKHDWVKHGENLERGGKEPQA
jgi:hypothetical protein